MARSSGSGDDCLSWTPADPIASKLNALPKYVASSTLTSAEWHNSSVLGGDVHSFNVNHLKLDFDGGITVLTGAADIGQGSSTLIDIDRAEVVEYLRARDIPWREDSSNASPAFARNRISDFGSPPWPRRTGRSRPRSEPRPRRSAARPATRPDGTLLRRRVEIGEPLI